MMLVDSHCHLDQLDLTSYNGSLDIALATARAAAVKHFLCVSIDMNNVFSVIALAEQYNDISASIGVHPTELMTEEPTVAQLVRLATHPRVVAIGETGLDYYRCQGDVSWQQERFRRHVRAAREVGKPLIVHSREAREDTIKLLREENAKAVGGVLHCFTETWEMAQEAMALNFYISFSGIVTFHNAAALQMVAKKVPDDRFLIETDSPYLAPMPYRGKPNEPAYVRFVAEKLAELRSATLEDIAHQSTTNFFRLFQQADRSKYANRMAQ